MPSLRLPIGLLLFAACGFGQVIGFPGQYPGQQRRYPGGGNQIPNQPQTTSLVGMLRSISSTDNSLVIETDQTRIVTITLEKKTKYINPSGKSAKIGDFQPGDHVEVAASQDNNDNYRAAKVTQLRQGTADEREQASKPVNESPSISSTERSNDDPDRPRLRRADSTPVPTPSSASSSTSSSSSSSDDDVVYTPRRRRAAVSNGDDTPSAQIVPLDSPNDDSPRLRLPDERASLNRTEPEPDRPTLVRRSADSGEVQFKPTGDPVIDMARDEAFTFSETLPNYVVKQFTTRYQTAPTRQSRGSSSSSSTWKTLDTVTADVLYQDGKESYRNIQVNGRTPDVAPEKSGSWSSGEFASMLQDVMSPITDADFQNKRLTTILNHAAYRYDYTVRQSNSHWHITAEGQSYQPEFTGAIWIDKENYRVLRIEMSARNMPRGFPLDQVESAIDYDYVLIGDQKYLLPAHSEALSCAGGANNCTRNTIEFRNYKKFTADTTITFQPDAN